MRSRLGMIGLVAVLAACDAVAPTPGPTATAVVHGVPALPALVQAMRTHRIVVLSDVHNDGYEYQLLDALIADPGVAGGLTVIGLGWGNAAYQGGVDRYVTGDDGAAGDVDRALDESLDGPGIWHQAVYRRLVDAVRALNLAQPARSPVRVILGEPAVAQGTITERDPCDPGRTTCIDHWLGMRTSSGSAAILDALGADGRALVLAQQFDVVASPGQADASLSDLLARAVGRQTVWTVLALGRTQRAAVGLGPTLHDASELYPLATTPIGQLSEEALFGHVTVSCDVPPCPTAAPPRPLAEVVDALLDVAR
jgi:hypothetical protein